MFDDEFTQHYWEQLFKKVTFDKFKRLVINATHHKHFFWLRKDDGSIKFELK